MSVKFDGDYPVISNIKQLNVKSENINVSCQAGHYSVYFVYFFSPVDSPSFLVRHISKPNDFGMIVFVTGACTVLVKGHKFGISSSPLFSFISSSAIPDSFLLFCIMYCRLKGKPRKMGILDLFLDHMPIFHVLNLPRAPCWVLSV